MKQKQLLFILLSCQAMISLSIDDHFTSTTGDVVIQSKNNDVTILADTNGSTGKINLQAGTTTPGTTTAGQIGISAKEKLILKAATRIMLEAPIIEGVAQDKVYTSEITTGTEFPGGVVNGDLIVHNNIIFNANLTITGNLIVRGGNVTINSGVDVTVTGDVIFDGKGQDKQVNIAGDIISGTDHGAQRFIIKNYNPTTGAPVAILGAVVVNGEVLITNNQVTTTVADGVFISGSVSAYGDITLSHNKGFTNGYGISITGSVESFTHGVAFVNNSSSGNGNGVFCSGSGKSITAHQSITFKSNKSSGSGHGVSIESSFAVTSSNNIIFKENTSTSGAKVNFASGTLTAQEVIFDEDTTISATGLVKSGTINGTTVVNGSLTVSVTTTFQDNLVVNKGSVILNAVTLTVTGDVLFDGSLGSNTYVSFVTSSSLLAHNLTIKNFNASSGTQSGCVIDGAVTIGTTTTDLLVGDVVIEGCKGSNAPSVDLQGNSVIKTRGDIYLRNNVTNTNGQGVCIFGDQEARNMTVSHNFGADTIGGVLFQGSTTTLSGDLTVSDNSTLSTIQSAAFLNNGTVIKALNGTITFARNTSGEYGVVWFLSVSASNIVEARNIVFADNISTTTSVTSGGVRIRSTGITAHDSIRFERNRSAGGSGSGVDLESYVQTCKRLYLIYNGTAGKQIINLPGAAPYFADYYGGTVTLYENSTATF